MAEQQQSRSTDEQRITGISAAVIEGARGEEDEKTNPEANVESMARPAPGVTDKSQSGGDSTAPTQTP